MPAKKPTTAPRAAYADKPITPLIDSFCDWIEREVGVKLDTDARRAVYLGSALRGDFQKSPANQRRLTEQAERIAAEKVAREQRKAERADKAAAKVEAAEPAKRKSAPASARSKASPTPSRRRPLPTPKAEVEA